MVQGKEFCFKHSSGEDIYLFNLQNEAGTEVSITNYGAIIRSFVVKQGNGEKNDVVLGFDKVQDYLSEDYLGRYPYFGAAIGRYGNRIRDARFTIDGKEYRLSKNMGDNNLHGGIEGFDKKAWKIASFDEKNNVIVLKYKSKESEEGFPGNLDVELRFQLKTNSELEFTYTATTDKPTAVNFTHHSYFNLNNGVGDIKNHLVKINASSYLEQDEELSATGELVAVENSELDFRRKKRIHEGFHPGGLDQSFEVSKDAGEMKLMAEATSNDSGLTLQVYSSDPIIHLYTGQGLASLKGKNGIIYGPYSGFCLETQKHPNAINIPHFPNTILRPLETYKQKNCYRLFPEK